MLLFLFGISWRFRIAFCYEEAAMLEPAAVALHALKRSGFKKGDTVVVIGPGTIGMILSQMVKLFGSIKSGISR